MHPPDVMFVRVRRFFAGAGLVGGCVQTTPYDVDVDPSRTGFIDRSIAELRQREPAPTPFKFVAIGDTHDAYDDFARAIRALNARTDVEFVAHTGDISDRGLLQELEWSYDLLSRIEVPVFLAMGNHDGISYGAEIWRRMFGPVDYVVHYGGWRFVYFNSNVLEFPGEAPDRDWLVRQIDERGDARVALVSHHPPNTEDVPGGDLAAFYDELLQSGKVALWIHGHLGDEAVSFVHGVPVLRCGTFQNGGNVHWIVTADGPRLSFERCEFDDCARVVPKVTEP